MSDKYSTEATATDSCSACGSEQENLLQCSSCKSAKYCNNECQRGHWKVHKTECRQISASKVATPASAGSCPYKPSGSSSGTQGVCPYRDLIEEKAMEDQVERCLGEGVKGLDELYHLSKSGEMIIQTPLQDAVGLVLSALEKNSFGLTESNIAYVLKAGDFISTMMHWTETEHVIRENYDKLICVAFRALMTPDAVAWAPIYTTVLTRLNSIDRDKCQQFLSRVRSNFHFLASIRAVAADEGWMRMQHRAKFVNEILQAPLTSS